MSSSYEAHFHNDLGQRLAILSQPIVSLDSIRMVNTVGTLSLALPYGAIPASFIQVDFLILIWKSINGGSRILMHQTVYHIQRWRHTNKAGDRHTTIECVDVLHLLKRRLIAYYAGSTQAQKASAAADNLMKAFVRENLASTASDYAGSTIRGLPATSLIVDPDVSLAASVPKAAAWRVLYDVLRELADSSRTAGTWLAFDLVVEVGRGLTFRTFINQRGIDRRTGPNAVLLSEATGTLINTELVTDFNEFATTIYAGGPGELSDRIIATASNALLVRSSVGRYEDFTTAYQGTSTAYVTSEAQHALSQRRPRQTLTGDVQESPSLIYDRDISFGDYVQIEAFGVTADARLDGVHTVLDESGRETITIALKSESVL